MTLASITDTQLRDMYEAIEAYAESCPVCPSTHILSLWWLAEDVYSAATQDTQDSLSDVRATTLSAVRDHL